MRYFYKTTGVFRNLYVIYKYIPPDIVLVFTEDITKKDEVKNNSRTAKLLKESEKRYRYLFESSPYSIGIFDFDGNLLDCNKATNMFLSKHTLEDDIIGKNFREFWSYHEKDKPLIPLFEKILEKITKDEKTLTFEFSIHLSIGDK